MVRCKVVLLGAPGVGKSTLLLRMAEDVFSPQTKSTVGAAFMTHTALSATGAEVALEIWDTAGQERYRSLAPLYYRNADVALVVYDMSRSATLEDAEAWIMELRAADNPPAEIFLVGNKCDLAEDCRAPKGYKTSAKTGVGVAGLFRDIVERGSGSKPRRRSALKMTGSLPSWFDCLRFWN